MSLSKALQPAGCHAHNHHHHQVADHSSLHNQALLDRHFQSFDPRDSSIEAKVAMSHLRAMRPARPQYSDEAWPEAPRNSYYDGHFAAGSEWGPSYPGPAAVAESDGYREWRNRESPRAGSSQDPFPQMGDDRMDTSMDASMAVDQRDAHVCHCGKAFRRPSDLTKHQKYHIKYFACLFAGCDRSFSTQKDLSRHVRTHTKGDGWKCSVKGCRKAILGHVYGRKDNFERHMRTAHPSIYEVME